MQQIPKWLKRRLSPGELEAIEKAVHAVESRTSGEVVPLIVRRTASITLVPAVVGLGLLALYFTIEFLAMDLLWWEHHAERTSMIGVLTLFCGWFLGSRPFVIRKVIGDRELKAFAVARARLEFENLNLRSTRDQTGILLMLSIDDHQAVVLADRGIATKLPPETWQHVLATLIAGAKSGHMASGVVAAIEKCGDILAEHFPPGISDPNEIPNGLVIRE